MNKQATKAETIPEPWWKSGYAWMVISGPVIVMVASFITFYYVARSPDPAIENYYVKGLEINKALEAETLAPAMKGRNHAATGFEAASKEVFPAELQ